jgi:hypothetical protein
MRPTLNIVLRSNLYEWKKKTDTGKQPYAVALNSRRGASLYIKGNLARAGAVTSPPWRRLQPLEVPPPRDCRFGSPLVVSRVHWVRPARRRRQYLTWTDDNLPRPVVYEGLREDKPAADVRPPVPHPRTTSAA